MRACVLSRMATWFDADTLPASPSTLSDPLLHHVYCHVIYHRIHNDFTLNKTPITSAFPPESRRGCDFDLLHIELYADSPSPHMKNP